MGVGQSPPRCPGCQSELLPDSRFCGRCGTPQQAAPPAQPPYPQPPYAQPPYPQPPYAQPPHPQPPDPQPPYPQPPHPQAPHPQHPQPPYPQPPPAFAYPPHAPPRRRGRTWLVALLVILVVAGGAVAGIVVGRRGGGHTPLIACPGGICPRFPISRSTRVEALDPAFGRVRLLVPAGALRAPTELSIRPAPPDARPPRIVTPQGEVDPTLIGPVVRFGPDGETFDAPLRLELPFDPAKVPPDAEVAVMTWNGAQAERLAPLAVDREAGVATVEVRHFSDLAAVIDPGATMTFVPPPPPPPPPCPTLTLTAEKCPWTPDGYSVGECTPGFCWDGGPQGFLACKQRDVAPGIARGENMNPYCAVGTPVYERCTGVLTACTSPPAAPTPP